MTQSRHPARPPWTPEEDATLRRHYPGKGYRACVEHLPDHTPNAIETRGRKLGLHGPKGPLSKAGLDARLRNLQAAHRRKRHNPERAQRRCLGVCGRTFTSEWMGHRMCDSCRTRAAGLGIGAPAS